MFTGIIQDIGQIASVRKQGGSTRLAIKSKLVDESLCVGDSISISGVCLTATSVTIASRLVEVTAVEETLKRTSLSHLSTGTRVNLELALRPNDRLGGHYVQGHVDAVGRCERVMRKGDGRELVFGFPPEFAELLVDKGSVAVDGVSLTAYDCSPQNFKVSAIPHTLSATTLEDIAVGAEVNLEFDILGKYVQRMMQRSGKRDLSIAMLRDYGY